MRSSLALGIASILVLAVPCVAAQKSEATEGLCLLQTKAAKHGRVHHAHETALSDIDTSAPDTETATTDKAVLLSSSGVESAHTDGLADDKKLQGITDLEAYGGSMMDLVLGGWRHSHENPAKKSSVSSSSLAVARTPKVAPEHDDSSSQDVVDAYDSSSQDVVDAFGDPIKDMDVDLLSTAPAHVHVEPILDNTPPVELAEIGPSEEPADKVLADAQKSLEAYSAVLSETEQISLLGQTADESESHQTQEESKPQQIHSRQHHESAPISSNAHHVVVKETAAATTAHGTSNKHSILLPKTADGAAHVSKDKTATASAKQPVHQKHPTQSASQRK